MNFADYNTREPISDYPNPAKQKSLSENSTTKLFVEQSSPTDSKKNLVENSEIAVKDVPEGQYALRVKDSYTKVLIKF